MNAGYFITAFLHLSIYAVSGISNFLCLQNFLETPRFWPFRKQNTFSNNPAVLEQRALEEGHPSVRPMAPEKAKGGSRGRPSKVHKTSQTAAVRDMLKRKAELGASIAAHAQFEAELKERMAAFATKEKEQMQRDCERLRDDRRKDIYRTDERITFWEESVEELKPKTGETCDKTQSRMILMLLFDLQKDGLRENGAVLKVSTAVKIGCIRVWRCA